MAAYRPPTGKLPVLQSSQTTLRSSVTTTGVGLHSGRPVRMTMRPAAANTGIIFHRTDIGGRNGDVVARFDNVHSTKLSTCMRNAAGTEVCTVEHVMAALYGLGVDNVLIELDGKEAPIKDGSALPFVDMILKAGILDLGVVRRAMRIRRSVKVSDGNKSAALHPHAGFRVRCEIDFDAEVISRQVKDVELSVPGAFATQVADARTFVRKSDIDMLQKNGLGLGGSLDNAVVVDGDRILNPDGLRTADEFVRHKALDVVGDLSLAGYPILGRFDGVRMGHALNNRLLTALFEQPDAYEIVTLGRRVTEKAGDRRLATAAAAAAF